MCCRGKDCQLQRKNNEGEKATNPVAGLQSVFDGGRNLSLRRLPRPQAYAGNRSAGVELERGRGGGSVRHC
jgi:hypothetical protein